MVRNAPLRAPGARSGAPASWLPTWVPSLRRSESQARGRVGLPSLVFRSTVAHETHGGCRRAPRRWLPRSGMPRARCLRRVPGPEARCASPGAGREASVACFVLGSRAAAGIHRGPGRGEGRPQADDVDRTERAGERARGGPAEGAISHELSGSDTAWSLKPSEERTVPWKAGPTEGASGLRPRKLSGPSTAGAALRRGSHLRPGVGLPWLDRMTAQLDRWDTPP
jgi:hypothetical protein